MKLFVFFSALFAFIFFVRTEDITLRILITHEYEPKEIGDIKGFLVGKNYKKEFILNKTLLLNTHAFIVDIDFPEKVEKILIKTNKDMPYSLSFYPIAMLSNFNYDYSLYQPENEKFVRGDTIVFLKNLVN